MICCALRGVCLFGVIFILCMYVIYSMLQLLLYQINKAYQITDSAVNCSGHICSPYVSLQQDHGMFIQGPCASFFRSVVSESLKCAVRIFIGSLFPAFLCIHTHSHTREREPTTHTALFSYLVWLFCFTDLCAGPDMKPEDHAQP